MSELPAGTVLGGRWTLMRQLGRGGMGRVYLATDRTTGKASAAVKVLDPKQGTQDEALVRFKREAEVLGQLEHPAAVKAFDFGCDAGRWYLAMELLEGETAEQLLAHSGPMAPAKMAALVLPVLAMLEVAHAKGIIHRDIKPSNVFVCAGPPPAVKVLDFGVARAGSDRTRITDAGMSMGTIAYMPPEQLFDSAGADERTDLYALGVMAYELLSGRLPFSGRGSALFAAIRAHAPPSLQQLAPQTPPALVALVARLMAKAPADRFSSATEVRTALLAAVRPDPTALFAGFGAAPRRSGVVVADESLGLGDTFRRAPSPWRRSRWRLAAAGAVAAGLAVATWLLLHR